MRRPALLLLSAIVLCLTPTARADEEGGEEKKAEADSQKATAAEKAAAVEAKKLSQVGPLMKMRVYPGNRKFDPADFGTAFDDAGLMKELELINPWVPKIPRSVRAVTRIDPVGRLSGLERLIMERIAVADLGPLRKLAALRELRIADCPRIRTLAPLGELAGLTRLFLEDLETKGVASVAKLVGLTELKLVGLGLKSLEFLAPLQKLRKLWLSRNPGITDLAAVSKLPALEELHLDGVGAAPLAPLRGLKTLRKLTVGEAVDTTPVQTIDGLEIERK